MLVAGFTFIRNAVLYDYPIVEAIRSVLPICDLMVVAVGQSDDETADLINRIGDPKIRIIPTVWDDSLRKGGRVLALETDKAFQAIPPEYDWCIYVQGDECLHEAEYPVLRAGMEQFLSDPATEGFLLKYRHFYGSYDFIGISRRWYRREVRIVRNNKQIHSYLDAQGFRWADGRKLRTRLLDAHMHHYGWVKSPAAQQRKQFSFNRLYHNDQWMEQNVPKVEKYNYQDTMPLERFTGTHPVVIQPRIQAVNWQFHSDPAHARWSLKERLSEWIEKHTGWRPGEHRNYILLK